MWDVEGAYLLADQDDFVVVKFTGSSVDVLCQVDEDYKQFVTIEKREESDIPTTIKGFIWMSTVRPVVVRV